MTLERADRRPETPAQGFCLIDWFIGDNAQGPSRPVEKENYDPFEGKDLDYLSGGERYRVAWFR